MGDLTAELKADYHGEFHKIKVVMETTTRSIYQTMHQIYEASEQVTHGSDQLVIGAQDLSQGVVKQASSIEQLSASVQNVAERVEGNALSAENVNRIASETRAGIEQGSQHMQAMLYAMRDIRTSSSEIHKIIKTIDDIAFQTNILALNAAVEAARAGESGKGFAVVADEVRNLAGKSAEAASHTTELIERSMLLVENGTKIADETSSSLALVVDAVKDAANMIEEIAQASAAQSLAISQIREGVNQISTVIQKNSSTAERSAAASEELSEQAQTLQSLVHRFKVGGVEKQTANPISTYQQGAGIPMTIPVYPSDGFMVEPQIAQGTLGQWLVKNQAVMKKEKSGELQDEIVHYTTEESPIDLDFGLFGENDKY